MKKNTHSNTKVIFLLFVIWFSFNQIQASILQHSDVKNSKVIPKASLYKQYILYCKITNITKNNEHLHLILFLETDFSDSKNYREFLNKYLLYYPIKKITLSLRDKSLITQCSCFFVELFLNKLRSI